MNLVGTWNLEVATPFGKHPATLVFEGAGGALNGHLSSRLGDAQLGDLSVSDDSFNAAVSLEFQGKPYDANIAGRVEGDQLDGTIKVKLAIAPTIKYTGTRAA
ncbi:MAG: hypothetical protein LC802_07240 [Acidobacteria bacterium]|nr:hypothetical protein [Acidobacteriota bacterium]